MDVCQNGNFSDLFLAAEKNKNRYVTTAKETRKFVMFKLIENKIC